MSRIPRLAAIVLLGAVMGVVPVARSDAEGLGPSNCAGYPPGPYIASVGQAGEINGYNNPGNAHTDYLPYVPFSLDCNPTYSPL